MKKRAKSLRGVFKRSKRDVAEKDGIQDETPLPAGVIEGPTTVEEPSEKLPLAGATVYMTFVGPNGEDDVWAANVEALGGRRVWSIPEATHALWLRGSNSTKSNRMDLERCKKYQVPVVDAASWLERVSGLKDGEHWSKIDVINHMPPLDWLEDDGAGVTFSPTIAVVRRDDPSRLSASINETYDKLLKETPNVIEEDEFRRAIELSMLDWALVLRRSQDSEDSKEMTTAAHDILGVNASATPEDIRAAYRRRALETHPDKGGSHEEFHAVARAYRSLLDNKIREDDREVEDPAKLKTTSHWDAELREHRSLVTELFQNHGADVTLNVSKQAAALATLGLEARDAGSSNLNEKNERIANSCFYLSLATSYLDGIGALSCYEDTDDQALKDADDTLIGETALQLKRTIEAAVVSAHPEWASTGMVGEEVQAFSDFLVYVLDSPTIVSDWAVAVFDSASGFVDVYKGKRYADGSDENFILRSNTLTICYLPGHYQPLLPTKSARCRPTLANVLSELGKEDVYYVVTDGAAP